MGCNGGLPTEEEMLWKVLMLAACWMLQWTHQSALMMRSYRIWSTAHSDGSNKAYTLCSSSFCFKFIPIICLMPQRTATPQPTHGMPPIALPSVILLQCGRLRHDALLVLCR